MPSNYGCHNRKDYRPRYFAQDGWWHDGMTRTARIMQVAHAMSLDCQYTHTELGQVDQGCNGCKHRVDLSTASGHNSGNPAHQR